MTDQPPATGAPVSDRHPLVEAAAFQALDVAAIGDVLKVSGFQILELGGRHIMGVRRIPGHPETEMRQVSFARIFGDTAWSGALYLRHPHPRAGELCGSKLNAPGARFPQHVTRLLHQLPSCRTVDELEAWLGGACSVVLDDAERRAIAAGEV